MRNRRVSATGGATAPHPRSTSETKLGEEPCEVQRGYAQGGEGTEADGALICSFKTSLQWQN
jgi:hypothetical protein